MINIRYRSATAANLRNVAALLLSCSPAIAFAVDLPIKPAAAQSRSAVGDRINSEAKDAATRAFYAQNGWSAVWTEAAVESLRQALADRAVHGLDRVIFLPVLPPLSDPASREIALTGAALRYAAALAHGAVDPKSLHKIYTLPRPQVDLVGQLGNAIAKGNLDAWLSSLAPQDAAYASLSKAYVEFSKEARSSATPDVDIVSAGLIHVGDTDERVPAIVKQLIENEYLTVEQPASTAPTAPAPVARVEAAGAKIGQAPVPQGATSPATTSSPPTLYTQRIAEAVTRLQQDYGIAADGIIGPGALEVLNLHPGDRARALAVALERLRWLARTPPETRIDVNTAAATMRYYRDGKLVDSRKVIVGKPGNETPQLYSPMYRLVANPTWTVPKSIESRELSRVSAGYLRKRNMIRKNGFIVQLPGANNALGLVKFDMQNNHAIYLHDTPSRSLFARSQRHLSHGCVRVADASGFAEIIAADEGIVGAWQQAQAGSAMAFVNLAQKLPVRLLYQNVYVGDDGQVTFRADPYDWNGRVSSALGFTEISSTLAKPEPVDVAP